MTSFIVEGLIGLGVRYFLRPQTIIFSKTQPAANFVCNCISCRCGTIWPSNVLVTTGVIRCVFSFSILSLLPQSIILIVQSEREGHHDYLLVCWYAAISNRDMAHSLESIIIVSFFAEIEGMASEPVCMHECMWVSTTSVCNLSLHKLIYTAKASPIYC